MNPCIIIPARYNSSRFPGKVLVNIFGKTVLQRVWEQCIKVVDPEDVYIATDDIRISAHCFDNHMKCVMSSKMCKTGTDRVAEVAKNFRYKNYTTIVNVQGDEPLVSPESIKKVMNSKPISCGFCKITNSEEFYNPNTIKVVMDNSSNLLYASRAAMPTTKKLSFEKAYKQVCIYSFSYDNLEFFSKFSKKSNLEELEDIEFLRFLEHGYKIKMVEVDWNSHSVDVPDDIKIVENMIKNGDPS